MTEPRSTPRPSKRSSATARRAGLPITSVAATLAAAGLLLAGCGSDTGTGTGTNPSASAVPSVSTAASLAAQVPEAIKSDGTITIGTDATYAPSEFLAEDGKTVQGFDVDLFDAVAAKLGLKTRWQSADFDTLVSGVTSNRYEIGVSSFTINADRLKAVDMVSYFSAGTQWATKAGNPSGVAIDAACGKRIAVQTGTVQDTDDLPARVEACTSAGRAAPTIDRYTSQANATSAVATGKDDAMLADSPVTDYAVKQTDGALATLGDVYDAAPYGYAIKKGQGQFAQAVQQALQQLVSDGTYRAILDRWGVTGGAITDPAVDPTPAS